MPEAVRELSDPWPTLVGRIENLTPEMEREFRFGQGVIRVEGQYRMGGHLKGGSSAMWVPSDEKAFNTYMAWKSVDGIPAFKSPRGYDRLAKLLRRHGAAIASGSSPSGEEGARQSERRGFLYELTCSVLGMLPPKHLDNPMFRKLQIGGWGPDAAKASAYDDRAVIIYDFAIGGARRTFVGLLLHEMGHACEASMQIVHRTRLEKLHRALAKCGALVGLEFLLDGASRKAYQQRVFEEFLAETYLIYTAFGRRLLDRQDGMPPAGREAWKEVYVNMKEVFDGYEYV